MPFLALHVNVNIHDLNSVHPETPESRRIDKGRAYGLSHVIKRDSYLDFP